MKYLLLILGLLGFSSLKAQLITSSNLNVQVNEIENTAAFDSKCSRVIIEVRYQESNTAARGTQLKLINQYNSTYSIPEDGKVEILTDSNQLSASVEVGQNQINVGYTRGSFHNIALEPSKSYHIMVYWKIEIIAEPIDPGPAVFKPVLYFYPEKEMDIDIQLQPHGHFTFTYPKYEKGWSAKISPDGNIKIAGRNYPYLFWEGQLNRLDSKVRQSGFVVKSEETVSFLEEKLELLGLNEREMTDLITFWAPKLEQNAYNYIHFVTGEDYEQQIAQLNLSQQADTEIRIHLWYAPLEQKIKVQEQILLPSKREGFTIVEWGGGAFDWMTP
jgi:hypothetical protein